MGNGISFQKKRVGSIPSSSFSTKSPGRNSPYYGQDGILPHPSNSSVSGKSGSDFFSYIRPPTNVEDEEDIEAEEGYESGLESEFQLWEQHKKEYEKRCKEESNLIINGGLNGKNYSRDAEQSNPDNWKERVFVPKKYEGKNWNRKKNEKTSPPSIVLPLYCVHGVNTENLRDSVEFVWESEIFWTCGPIIVLFNFRTQKYKFLNNHDHEIVATAYLPQKGLLATSQGGLNPKILVWDIRKARLISVLRDLGISSTTSTDPGSSLYYGKKHRKFTDILGVTSTMDFTPDGSFLVSVLEHDEGETTVCVMDWKMGSVEIRSHQHLPKLLQVRCNPYCPADRFVTVGKKHCGFWRIQHPSRLTSAISIATNNSSSNGKNLSYTPGVFRKQTGLKRTMVCITFLKKYTVTGSSSGEIYVWDNVSLFRVIDAHHGPVNCLRNYNNGVITGGKDGYLHIYNRRFMRKEIVNFNRVSYCDDLSNCEDNNKQNSRPLRNNNLIMKLNVPRNSIKSLRILHSKALVATVTNSIYEIGLKSKRINTIARNHFNELSSLQSRCNNSSAIDCHPAKTGFFASVSSDRTLRIWNFSQVQNIRETDASPCSISYSPSGNLIAVGTQFGCISVYDSSSLQELIKRKDRCEMIRILKFSPNGRYIASVSTHAADIYDIKMNFSLIGICEVKDRSFEPSPPQNIMFSPNSVGRSNTRSRSGSRQIRSSQGSRSSSSSSSTYRNENDYQRQQFSEYRKKKRPRINSMDWSLSSKFIRINSLYPLYNIYYFEIGEKRIRAIVNKIDLIFGDEDIDYSFWYSNTCPLSFGCSGVLDDLNLVAIQQRQEEGEDGGKVPSSYRSSSKHDKINVYFDREFLQVTSDGKFVFVRHEKSIRVYKFPVFVKYEESSKSQNPENSQKNENKSKHKIEEEEIEEEGESDEDKKKKYVSTHKNEEIVVIGNDESISLDNDGEFHTSTNGKKRMGKKYVEFTEHGAEITVFKIDPKNNHLYSIDIDNNIIIRKILY